MKVSFTTTSKSIRQWVVLLIGGLIVTGIFVGPAHAQRWGDGSYEGFFQNIKINRLSDAFRYSPSSQFAPADGEVNLNWIDQQRLKVVKVTKLDNEGKGTLRHALEQQTGPRLVVFEVGGVIDLKGHMLTIPKGHGNVIVAGQTAPDPGITLIRDAMAVKGHNVILQHLRIRPGTDIVHEGEEPESEGHAVDALWVGGHYDTGNHIVDHCTVTWGSDEVLSTAVLELVEDGKDLGPGKRPHVTISNTIIADGLADTDLHPENRHDKGSLLYGALDYSVMGNLYANVEVRPPFLGRYGGSDAAIVNTLIHHVERGIQLDTNGLMRVALVGNEFTMEPRHYNLRKYSDYDPTDKLFMHDNEYSKLLHKDAWEIVDQPPIARKNIVPLPRKQVIAHHVQTVGARPAGRTRLDRRVINQVKQGEGRYIDSQEDVGGYPTLKPSRRRLDVPADPASRGIWLYRQTWEVEHRD